MSRTFNPNTNPYADDLLRLGLAPRSRFSPAERRTIGLVLAAKLYGLDRRRWHFAGPPWWLVSYLQRHGNHEVAMALVFDDESHDLTVDRIERNRIHSTGGETVIVLTVGVAGVVEVFNGAWMADSSELLKDAFARIRSSEDSIDSPTENELPTLSDDELRYDYLGRNGDGGGNGGRNDGTPPGGEGGSFGSGGTGELLNHPILFSIDREVFNSIMEQV